MNFEKFANDYAYIVKRAKEIEKVIDQAMENDFGQDVECYLVQSVFIDAVSFIAQMADKEKLGNNLYSGFTVPFRFFGLADEEISAIVKADVAKGSKKEVNFVPGTTVKLTITSD